MKKSGIKIFAVDVETTGTNPGQHSIWQIAGIVLIDGKEKERFEILMQPNPKAKIDPDAFNPSKDKTPEQVQAAIDKLKTYMPFEQGYQTLLGILSKYVDKYDKTDKFFFLAHNAGFDNDFLRGLFKQNGDDYFGSWFWPDYLCTRVLAIRQFMPIRHTLPNFQLMTVARQVGINIDESRLHDAVYDIELTIEIFKRLRLTESEINGLFDDFKMQEAIQLAFEQLEEYEALPELDQNSESGKENIQIALNILRKFIKPAVAILIVLISILPTDSFAQFKDKGPKGNALTYHNWLQRKTEFKGYRPSRKELKLLGKKPSEVYAATRKRKKNNKK